MANQSIGTPRFFIDFTQLAKLKGQFYWEEGIQNVNHIFNNSLESNNNIWNFDFYKNQTYEAISDDPSFYFHTNNDESFSRIAGACNWAGFFNHNFASSFSQVPTIKFGLFRASETFDFRSLTETSNVDVNVVVSKDGFSIGTFDELGGDDVDIIILGLRDLTIDATTPFSVACASFGRYYDMPNSPDLSITKSIQYEGVKIQRTLGGSDYVQINNSGTPNWISGEPFALVHPDESSSRFGRHGRRSWKLKFSYISNDDLFFDLNRPNVFGDLINAEGSDSNEISAGSEIQQIFDLTLGGALSFIFCPDKDATNPEFAQCRLDQESLQATQVAHQTWDVSMNIVEIW